MAEIETGADGETDELTLRLDEVSTTVISVSGLVTICIALAFSVPVPGLRFMSWEGIVFA